MGKLFFVGNLTLDDIVHADGRTQMGVAGGNGLYAAVGARIWGSQVAIISITGKDWPHEFTEAFQAHGIDTAFIRSVDSETLRAWVLYEQDGQRTYVARNNELISLRPNVYDDATLTSNSLAHFGQIVRILHQRMSPLPNMYPHLNVDAIHICPMRFETMLAWGLYLSQGSRIISTADMFPISLPEETNRSDLVLLLGGLDAFLPSMAEARLLGVKPNGLLSLCKNLSAYGPRIIVIKDGRNGAYVFARQHGRLRHIPAFPTSIVDTTGAGDAFCGGFLAGMISTGDPIEAALWGAVSASFIVENYGGLHGLNVVPKHAKERLNTLKQRME